MPIWLTTTAAVLVAIWNSIAGFCADHHDALLILLAIALLAYVDRCEAKGATSGWLYFLAKHALRLLPSRRVPVPMTEPGPDIRFPPPPKPLPPIEPPGPGPVEEAPRAQITPPSATAVRLLPILLAAGLAVGATGCETARTCLAQLGTTPLQPHAPDSIEHEIEAARAAGIVATAAEWDRRAAEIVAQYRLCQLARTLVDLVRHARGAAVAGPALAADCARCREAHHIHLVRADDLPYLEVLMRKAGMSQLPETVREPGR